MYKRQSLEIGETDGWFTRDKLPESLLDLLSEIGGTYAPFLIANGQAIEAGDSELSCLIEGREYKQAPFAYQNKCLSWIREAFRQLSADNQDAVTQILSGTGCEVLIADV